MPRKKIAAQASDVPVTVKEISVSIPKWAPVAVIIFTALLYCKALQNGFTYMDDDVYILKNPYLHDFSIKGIIAIFSKFNNANYHPFTTITNLFEYRFFGLDPLPYHLTNLLLHLLNTWLVYLLTEKLSNKRITALIVCILFAVHPLHVESVAWLSERKDVLYSAFYLLSLLAYLRYISSNNSKKYYIYTLLLFIASCLSKSAATTLPILLIAIDIYKGRKIDAKALIEKIPFIALSVFFGILAIMSQKAGGGMLELSEAFGFINRVFLFTSRIAFYLIESIIPFRLCALNCLPNINGDILPWYYYLSLPLLLAFAWLVARKSNYRKEVIFGIAFFLITISVMLQIVNVGYALTAERYTYIPYIGLFYIAGQLGAAIINKHRNYVIVAFSVFVVILSVMTWNRIDVWKDTDVLFTDIVEKNPDNLHNYIVYNSWGDFKNSESDLLGAIENYSKAIDLNPQYELAYAQRGLIYARMGNIQKALNDFNKAIVLNPKRAHNYYSRASEYYKAGNKKAAMLDYNQTIGLDPDYAQAYNDRGWAYFETGDIKSALNDFDKAITLKPTFSTAYYNRAEVKINTGELKGAIEDYNNILSFHPTDSLAYFEKGMVRMQMKDSAEACKEFKKAADLGFKEAPKMLRKYCH